jgi:hypothetical protein
MSALRSSFEILANMAPVFDGNFLEVLDCRAMFAVRTHDQAVSRLFERTHLTLVDIHEGGRIAKRKLLFTLWAGELDCIDHDVLLL